MIPGITEVTSEMGEALIMQHGGITGATLLNLEDLPVPVPDIGSYGDATLWEFPDRFRMLVIETAWSSHRYFVVDVADLPIPPYVPDIPGLNYERKYYAIGGVVLGMALLVGGVWYFTRRKKRR